MKQHINSGDTQNVKKRNGIFSMEQELFGFEYFSQKPFYNINLLSNYIADISADILY